jgi:predicted 3-demethylubiquinone-9 3-methyltransferase (glyoxalase superfamily)
MAREATPLLMFTGRAGEAMAFYTALFPGSAVESVELYGPGEMGAEGTVKRARFTVAGRAFLCIDSPPVHAFTFTPSTSIFVECDDAAEFDAACVRLAEGGQFLMPPDDYGFSARFAWLNDRFGVSWQLNLA